MTEKSQLPTRDEMLKMPRKNKRKMDTSEVETHEAHFLGLENQEEYLAD